MKWLVIVVAIFALLAGVGTATAQKKSKKNYSSSQSAFVQRDVSGGRSPGGMHQRGPDGYYPHYPQSPPGIG